jgi:excisionase family DNA binding protein
VGERTALLTLGQAAERLGVPIWQVQRLYERKRLPAPRRLGRFRAVTEEDLPAIGQALRAAGYLRPAAAGGALAPA